MSIGSCTMYKLRPLVNFSHDIELSGNIYKMKNVSKSSYTSSIDLPGVLEQVNNLLKRPLSEVEELKQRQDSILKQLTYLKEQMASLRNELNIKSSKTTKHCQNEESTLQSQTNFLKPSWDDVVGDVVIHASPACPPYSLLAINQLWPNILQLQVNSHAHSSVTSLPSHLSAFSMCHSSKPNLNIRLIWKQMESDCTLVISPLNNCLLRGEVNFLRYLQRMVLSPSDIVMEVKLNGTLDICHRLSHARTARDKQSLIRALNARLGKGTWLNGESMSIADLAAWSTLRSATDIDLTQNLIKWRSRCDAAAGVIDNIGLMGESVYLNLPLWTLNPFHTGNGYILGPDLD